MSLNFKFPLKGEVYIPEKVLVDSKDLNPQNSSPLMFDLFKNKEQPKNNQKMIFIT